MLAAVGLLVATFVDVATDGFIIGAGFAAGAETGLGSMLLAGASPAVPEGTLPFSAAARLDLVTEEPLTEAHEVDDKPVATLVLFGAFLTFWGLQLTGH